MTKLNYEKLNNKFFKLLIIYILIVTIFAVLTAYPIPYSLAQTEVTAQLNTKLHTDLERSKTVHISVGDSISLPAQAQTPVHVSEGKVLHIEDKGARLRLTALKPGDIYLTNGTYKYYVKVLSSENFKLYSELKALIGPMMGPLVDTQSERTPPEAILLKGHLHRFDDWKKISEGKSRHPRSQLQAHWLVDEDVQAEMSRYFKEVFSAMNLSSPTWTWGSPIQARLSQELESKASMYKSVLDPFGIAIEFQDSEVNIQPLIRVHIVVAEVSKKLETQIGIQWPESYAAQLSPKFDASSDLNIFLKALEERGLGQILASPNLLARSGSEAQFLAGGEFPIRIISKNTREVLWKRHGIFLDIKPQADHSGRMSVEITTEVSMIDTGSSVDGIPGLKTNRMSSHFDLDNSRTIVLSGLVRQEWFHSQRGLPGLSQIPILGHLFKSQEFLNNKSELVVFVTPEIIQPDTDQ